MFDRRDIHKGLLAAANRLRLWRAERPLIGPLPVTEQSAEDLKVVRLDPTPANRWRSVTGAMTKINIRLAIFCSNLPHSQTLIQGNVRLLRLEQVGKLD